MIKKLWIPYMGGKRVIASQLVDFMLQENPNAKYVYDLFWGGWAMSFEFMQRPQIKKVHYNEYNPAVVALLKKIQEEWVKDPAFFKWYSREEFKQIIQWDDWLAWFLQTCWSFGNNKQKGYMFSNENEELKKPLHEMVVYKSKEAQVYFEQKYNIKIDDSVFDIHDLQERRLALMRQIKNAQPVLLEELSRTQQLERVQQLQQLQQLQLSSLSYDEVVIDTPVDETIIYLDPPYKGTARYKNEIDYDKLTEYVKNSPYKVYVSSYDYPELKPVYEIEKRVVLSATNNSAKAMEKLFNK